MAWELTYKEVCPSRPYLFYAAVGGAELVAKASGWRRALPSGLEVTARDAGTYREGALWDMLVREQPDLAGTVGGCSHAVVVMGEIASHDDLEYLRETLAYLSFLVEEGASAIYDPFTLSWHAAEAWQELVARGSEFDPFDHVTLLSSGEEGGTTWLHTRGLLKFGRPDLSVHGVGEGELEMVVRMLERFIAYQARGGVIEPGREVRMAGLDGVYRPGAIEGDIDDPDFINAHVEIVRER